MIVCHCHCIDHTAIEEATTRLVAENPWRLVTAGSVYRTLGKRARCAGCMPLATSLIYAHLQCRSAPDTPCPMAALANQIANQDVATAGETATEAELSTPRQFLEAAE